MHFAATHNLYFLLHSLKASRGTGFIAELHVSEAQRKVVLMTSSYVFPAMSVARMSDIYFGRVSDDNPGSIIKGEELFDSQFFKTDDEDVSSIGHKYSD